MLKKLKSRKLWVTILGVIGGAAGLPILAPAAPYLPLAYIVMEGLADAFGARQPDTRQRAEELAAAIQQALKALKIP